MKKVLFCVLSLLLATNIAYAAKWITIKATNGKTALLDTQNIDIEKDTVKYWVKTIKNGYTYRYYMMSDCSSQTSCIVEIYKYDSNGYVVDSNTNAINLEKIVPDTLNEALYRNVCELVKQNPACVDSTEWSMYLESIQEQIKQTWKPKYNKTKEARLITSVSYRINKNGDVLSKEFIRKSSNEDYDKSIEETLNQVKSFATLPTPFEGNLEFVITFDYALKGGANKESVVMNSNGNGEILVSKSKLHAGEAVVNCVVGVIALPFVILGALLE